MPALALKLFGPAACLADATGMAAAPIPPERAWQLLVYLALGRDWPGPPAGAVDRGPHRLAGLAGGLAADGRLRTPLTRTAHRDRRPMRGRDAGLRATVGNNCPDPVPPPMSSSCEERTDWR